MTIKDINTFVQTELEYLGKEIKGLDAKGIKYQIQKVLEKATDGTKLFEHNFHLASDVVQKLYVVNLTPYNYDVSAIMQEIKKYKFANVLANTQAIKSMFDMYKYGDKFYVQGLRGMHKLHTGYAEQQIFEIFKREFIQGFKAYLRLKGRNKAYHGVEQRRNNTYISDSSVNFEFVLKFDQVIELNIGNHVVTDASNELLVDLNAYLTATKLEQLDTIHSGDGETKVRYKFKVLEGAITSPVKPQLPLQDLIDILREESRAKTDQLKELKAKQDVLNTEIFELNVDINILAKAKTVADQRMVKK